MLYILGLALKYSRKSRLHSTPCPIMLYPFLYKCPTKCLQDQYGSILIIYMNIKTSIMSYIIKSSIEVVESCSDDRFIYIKREGDEIVGLNFCQGTSESDYAYFENEFCKPDRKLTIFYESIKVFLGGDSELDRVNQAIWAYIEYRNLCNS